MARKLINQKELKACLRHHEFSSLPLEPKQEKSLGVSPDWCIVVQNGSSQQEMANIQSKPLNLLIVYPISQCARQPPEDLIQGVLRRGSQVKGLGTMIHSEGLLAHEGDNQCYASKQGGQSVLHRQRPMISEKQNCLFSFNITLFFLDSVCQ